MAKFGTAMNTVIKPRVRFEPRGSHKYQDDLHWRIVEVRTWLRTNLSIPDIAENMGVPERALARFCKRRNLCNLRERASLIAKMKMARSI